jgi:hypothetical protein
MVSPPKGTWDRVEYKPPVCRVNKDESKALGRLDDLIDLIGPSSYKR